LSIWQRIRNWGKAEPVFIPVYPILPGIERVAEARAVTPAAPAQVRSSKPARNPYRGNKPWNKIKAAQKIATGVVAEMRSADFDQVYTIAEINEWILEWCKSNDIKMGSLTLGAVRTTIKQLPGVHFENRRLLTDPLFHFLRRRHKARKVSVPERAWIFVIEPEPDQVAASLQPNERRAA
jgi:hypothetical protein